MKCVFCSASLILRNSKFEPVTENETKTIIPPLRLESRRTELEEVLANTTKNLQVEESRAQNAEGEKRKMMVSLRSPRFRL